MDQQVARNIAGGLLLLRDSHLLLRVRLLLLRDRPLLLRDRLLLLRDRLLLLRDRLRLADAAPGFWVLAAMCWLHAACQHPIQKWWWWSCCMSNVKACVS